ncbi:uncharacterized mitochondrial protein AtMg00820-like [Capsicum annuum]|uniref:uncharacterized mitochondrial protein AtMg00820-like n=1 Tax=Capsicum annuum TaxID=4072 RepID=UPI001FB05955|nr:uncharacterized mitochondrial protein AtMg00820-like [Capsicum annuum]
MAKGLCVLKHSSGTTYALGKYLTYDKLSPKYQECIAKSTTTTEPTNHSEVVKDPGWIEVMKNEINALEGNQTWEIASLPEEKKPIRCKWIFKVKYKAIGDVERFKARLVTKGYSQQEGIDFQETFSPVVMMKTVRANLIIAYQKQWYIH